jgi:hypothetical protein
MAAARSDCSMDEDYYMSVQGSNRGESGRHRGADLSLVRHLIHDRGSDGRSYMTTSRSLKTTHGTASANENSGDSGLLRFFRHV